jgi:hypothetical protein
MLIYVFMCGGGAVSTKIYLWKRINGQYKGSWERKSSSYVEKEKQRIREEMKEK